MNRAYYNSPIGLLLIEEEDNCLLGVNLVEEQEYKENPSSYTSIVIEQLKEYFLGKRKEFTLKLKMGGTPYMKRVWEELIKIPYGETISYQEMARRVGNIKGSRSAGMACGKNNILIIIPCHRVIGKNGKLTGFGAGLPNKEFLLTHEVKYNLNS